MTDTIRNERLTALAEFFEAGAPHFEFSISTGFAFKGGSLDEAIDGKCQTAGCIAGFAFMQAMKEKPPEERPFVINDDVLGEGELETDWYAVSSHAARYLGLTPIEANALFEGYRRSNRSIREITARDAGKAIRQLMAGEAPWSGDWSHI